MSQRDLVKIFTRHYHSNKKRKKENPRSVEFTMVISKILLHVQYFCFKSKLRIPLVSGEGTILHWSYLFLLHSCPISFLLHFVNFNNLSFHFDFTTYDLNQEKKPNRGSLVQPPGQPTGTSCLAKVIRTVNFRTSDWNLDLQIPHHLCHAQ